MGFLRRRSHDPNTGTTEPTLAASADPAPGIDPPEPSTARLDEIDHLRRVQAVALAVAQDLDDAKQVDATNDAAANPPPTREQWLACTEQMIDIFAGIASEAEGFKGALDAGREPEEPSAWSPEVGDQEAALKVLSGLRHTIDSLAEQTDATR
jgi:hypothetical protein